jgi:predicted RNA-binding Zn-ribbon protein involved in translation (DUF1610 family)
MTSTTTWPKSLPWLYPCDDGKDFYWTYDTVGDWAKAQGLYKPPNFENEGETATRCGNCGDAGVKVFFTFACLEAGELIFAKCQVCRHISMFRLNLYTNSTEWVTWEMGLTQADVRPPASFKSERPTDAEVDEALRLGRYSGPKLGKNSRLLRPVG